MVLSRNIVLRKIKFPLNKHVLGISGIRFTKFIPNQSPAGGFEKLLEMFLELLTLSGGDVDESLGSPPMPELKGLENKVYNMLSEEPIHIDYLAQHSQRTIPQVLSTLLTLELLGIVKQLSGKMFVRIPR